MKSLNKYINESLLDELDDLEAASDSAIENELIEKFLKENYYIRGNYTINNGVVDVNGNVVVKNKNLTELTNGMFVFGVIEGTFDCYNCTSLKSLKGAPKTVGSFFDCSCCNKLKSLEGAPKEIRDSFYCSGCDKLTSLKGAPKEVGESFYCYNCTALTSLKGAPKNVKGYFNCSRCTSLTSLEGAPKKVGSSFFCNSCGTSFTKEYVKSLSNVKPNNIYV